MSVLNRLFKNAPTCRAELNSTDSFTVESKMLETSRLEGKERARVLITKAGSDDGLDADPTNQFFFKTTLFPASDGDVQVLIPDKGVEDLGLEPGDIIVYMMAPEQPFEDFNGPLSEIGKPVRDAAANATGRDSSDKAKDVTDVERPQATAEETSFSDAALFRSGQVTFPAGNRSEIGVIVGDDVYVEADHNGNSTEFTATIGSGNRFNVPNAAQDELGIDANESTGDNRIEIDSITAKRIDGE